MEPQYIEYTKTALYKLKIEDLKGLAVGRGIVLSGEEKEKDLVNAIFAQQNEKRLNGDGLGNGESAAAPLGDGPAAQTAPARSNVELTPEGLLDLKSDVATDVFNALRGNFEENNKANLEKAMSISDRLEAAETKIAALEAKLLNAGTLHGSIDGLKAPY